MARLAGVDIPRDKRVVIALTYIYGIGRTRSVEILKATEIDESIRVKDLSDDQLVALRAYIEGNYTVEGDLRREVADLLLRAGDRRTDARRDEHVEEARPAVAQRQQGEQVVGRAAAPAAASPSAPARRCARWRSAPSRRGWWRSTPARRRPPPPSPSRAPAS